MQRNEIIEAINKKTIEAKKLINEINDLKKMLNNYNNQSKSSFTNEEKVKIFMDYFKGRDNVYPYLSIDKKDPSKKYYIPKCANEWNKMVCYKTMGKKCKDCQYWEDKSIDKVMLLDRVQKGFEITKEQSDYLRKDNLIEGRYPNIYISSDIAKITNKEKDYIDNKGLDNSYYKDYILIYIEKFGKATREEINKLIYPKLPTNMNDKNKNNRVRYIISTLRKDNKIINEGTDAKPCWVIKNQK